MKKSWAAEWHGRRLISQRMTGVYQTEDGSRYFTVEILAKSPSKSLYKLTSPEDVVIRDVCDGRSAWLEDPHGVSRVYRAGACKPLSPLGLPGSRQATAARTGKG